MSTTVIVSFQTKPDQVDALAEFLSAVQPGAIQGGCKSIALHKDQNDPTLFFEIEKWDSAEAHQAFVKAAAEAGAFAPFDTILAAPFVVNYLSTVKETQA